MGDDREIADVVDWVRGHDRRLGPAALFGAGISVAVDQAKRGCLAARLRNALKSSVSSARRGASEGRWEALLRRVGLTILATSVASALSSATTLAAPTLCAANEKVIFSCSTGAHTASICASKDLSKDAAMQYRFGKPGSLELVYPEAGAKPAEAFASGTLAFSGGGGAWLRFSKEPFRYTIFTAIGKWGRGGALADASGVAIEKDGKEFANFPCRSGAESQIGPDLIDKLGMQESTDEFDIPDAFLPK
jgi:hypothetical protein